MELELVRELLELNPSRRLGMLGRETNGRTQHGEVQVDLLDNAGTPHLDDGVLASRKETAMRLGDRRRGEGLPLEAHERLLAEVLPHHRLDLRKGNGRDIVDE